MGSGSSKAREYEVTVHVYRLIGDTNVSSLMDSAGFGAFHSGVEVGGREYSFGGGGDDGAGSMQTASATGVWSQPPRQLPPSFTGASYKESVAVGVAVLTPAELKSVLSRLRREWPGAEHDLLRRNCNHFTAAACAALGVEAPPQYINRLANAGARAAGTVASMARTAGTVMSMMGGLAAMARTMADGATAATAAVSPPPQQHQQRQQQQQQQQQWREQPAASASTSASGAATSGMPE